MDSLTHNLENVVEKNLENHAEIVRCKLRVEKYDSRNTLKTFFK